uniref:Tannase and feruloyl esterase n=1 Tax=Caulobacter sp. (strain K31) TaxID=366602 RepID=B0T3R4_CAUSK
MKAHALTSLLALVLAPSLALAPTLARAAPAVASLDAERCAGLKGLAITPAQIGLATRGASITDAVLAPAGGKGPSAFGEHCLVSGEIRPADPAAPSIQFQIALPGAWNGKALMLGGGGFNGSIPKLSEAPYNLSPAAASPLARGYAVFGGDGGHQAGGKEPGAFLLNDEAYLNWMGDALKKTRDSAVRVIEAAYGKAPAKRYFLGGSSGGREGLMVAGRWPTDWDGVIALYPARNQMVEIMGGLGVNQALAAPGAFPSRAKRGVLFQAALAACDTLDGAKDGVITNVKACNATFDPAKATLNRTPVRCPQGQDTGDTCLSDSQLKALATINGVQTFSFPLASGETSFPGYNVYTSDTGVPSDSPLQQMVNFLALGSTPPGFPATPAMSLMATFGDNFVRYGVARDTSFNPLSLGPKTPGALAGRISEMSKLDVADRDLSAFAARGGKLILMHGAADMIVSPRISETYVEGLRARMGAKKVDGFLRFYEVAGFSHAVSTNFGAAWDYLTALENWTERGVDPAERQIVTDLVGVPGRTRPLCLYPAWPRYKGAGDINLAASFTCARR